MYSYYDIHSICTEITVLYYCVRVLVLVVEYKLLGSPRVESVLLFHSVCTVW